jgi:hypothetical protein
VFLILTGGLIGKYLLGTRPWRWVALFVLLAAPMFFVQRQLFAATPHIEAPGLRCENPWVEAFDWIRDHTPEDAYFAIDADAGGPAEAHGFRALAERSMLADNGKDGGVVSMFPALADEWQRQLASQNNWRNFGLADFARLKQERCVTWVVVSAPGLAELDCHYRNRQLAVCEIP